MVEDRVFFLFVYWTEFLLLAFHVEQNLSILLGVIQRQVDVCIISQGERKSTQNMVSLPLFECRSADATNRSREELKVPGCIVAS